MSRLSMIDCTPGVRSGKPSFVGTQFTVYDVLEYLASGMNHIRAALEFAALRERRLATST